MGILFFYARLGYDSDDVIRKAENGGVLQRAKSKGEKCEERLVREDLGF